MYDYPSSMCFCVKSVNQSVSHNSLTDVVWAEHIDQGGWFDAASNTLIIIPHSMAAVQLSAQVQYSANAGEDRFLQFTDLNGAAKPGLACIFYHGPVSNSRARLNLISPPIQVSSGDIFKVVAFQNTGVSLNIEADADTWLCALKVDSLHGALVTLGTGPFSLAGGAVLDYIEWNSEVYDTGNFWSSSSPSMFYFSTGSVTWARFYAGVQVASNSALDEFFLNIDKNGASFPGGGSFEYSDIVANGRFRGSLVSAVVQVQSGDYFEVQIRKSAAGNLNVESSGHSYFAFEVIDDG